MRDSCSERQADPDCMTCALRKGCDAAMEGTFCTRWRAHEPEPRGKDPNRAWERGEEAGL